MIFRPNQTSKKDKLSTASLSSERPTEKAKHKLTRMREKLRANKKKIIIGFIILLIISILLTAYIFISTTARNKELMDKKLASYNQSQLQVSLKQEGAELQPNLDFSKLNFNFVTEEQVLPVKLAINIKNKSNFNYLAEIKGSVDTTYHYTTDTTLIDLAKADTQIVNLELPLKYSKEQGTITILLKYLNREVKYQWFVTTTLLKDSETISLKADLKTTALVFSGSQKPSLAYSLEVNNNSAFPVNAGYYQLNLVNLEQKLVQPLLVEGLDLLASEQKKFSGEFQFSIPPADLDSISSRKYKLQLVYKGTILERKLETAVVSGQDFNFELKSY